jgi:hypothetical protein
LTTENESVWEPASSPCQALPGYWDATGPNAEPGPSFYDPWVVRPLAGPITVPRPGSRRATLTPWPTCWTAAR